VAEPLNGAHGSNGTVMFTGAEMDVTGTKLMVRLMEPTDFCAGSGGGGGGGGRRRRENEKV
jgi:hypothetical protein